MFDLVRLTRIICIPRVIIVNDIGVCIDRCTSLKEIDIPDGVTAIGKGAFCKSGLISVVLPDGITDLNESMFDTCADLRSVQLPANLVSIGDYAFSDCSNLTGITLPASLRHIGSLCFRSCLFTELTLPEGLETIADFALEHTALTRITIPDSVTEGLSAQTFLRSANLQEIVFSGNNPSYMCRDGMVLDKTSQWKRSRRPLSCTR